MVVVVVVVVVQCASGTLTWTRFQNCASSATARVGVEQSGPRMKTLVGGSNRLRAKPLSEGAAEHYTGGKRHTIELTRVVHEVLHVWSSTSWLPFNGS